MRVVFTVLALLLGAIVLMGASTALQPAAAPLRCQQATVPVAMGANQPARYHVVGWLCARGTPGGKTVQLLMSGLTYDHNYWDLPYRPDTYSYVRSATSFGYATFNVDRIGVGASDKPPADQVTVASQGYVTHELVQALRRGAVAGTPFAKVIGVGHSLGAAIWIAEASTFTDIDGLVLADYLHQPNAAVQAAIGKSIYPAQNDPRFAGLGLPAGYFTTVPGTREADFYRTAVADPNVVAQDEALKQTATSGERSTLNLVRDPRYSEQITVPTLLVVGQYDQLGCDAGTPGLSCATSAAVLSRERSDYPTSTCLEAFVLPGAGHDTNLHPNAVQWFVAASGWADRRVGAGTGVRPSQPCRA